MSNPRVSRPTAPDTSQIEPGLGRDCPRRAPGFAIFWRMLRKVAPTGPVVALTLAGCVSVATPPRPELRLGMPFSDHMVIQAHVPVRIWGTAAPGETLWVDFAGQTARTVAGTTGSWRADLPALDYPPDHAPQRLIVRGEGRTLQIDDVVIGEVWLCSGQSNMRFTLGRKAEPRDADAPLLYPTTLAGARHAQVRLLNVSGGTPPERTWARCAPETVASFSAVGYHFGVALHRARNVPVGLVDLGKGGAAIRAFISRETFAAHPEFGASYRPETRPGFKAGGVFHQDLQPFAPFAVRGVLWYQGEGDASRASLYPAMLSCMIANWRSVLESPELPFLIVQLPPWERRRRDPPRTSVGHTWAELRAAQGRVVETIPQTYLVAIGDLGERLDIHPRRKREVGERLAALARAAVYGESVPAHGPELESVTRSADTITLTFSHTEGGLLARGETLLDFEVAGDDGEFVSVNAEITAHDQIVVRCPEGLRAKTLRYAWRDYYEPTLFNGDGWPAPPFQCSVP